MKKSILALGIAFTVFSTNITSAQAASNATVSFTKDEKLEYSNVSEDGNDVNLGSAFEGVAPGETRSQTITVRNDSGRTADFYMSAEVVEALERNTTAAKGAGYEIKLTAGDNVLYDSMLGGYAAGDDDSASTVGMEEMNETLDGYIFIATLKNDETADVVLSITFDGEAMDNTSTVDYSRTEGQLAFEFKAGYEDPTGTTTVYKTVTKEKEAKRVTEIVEDRVPLTAVATGDASMIGVSFVVLLAGVILVVMGKRKGMEEQS